MILIKNYIFVPNLVENVFWNWQFISKFLAVLRQNIVAASYHFFHAFYYVLGVVFQKTAAASHPFFHFFTRNNTLWTSKGNTSYVSIVTPLIVQNQHCNATAMLIVHFAKLTLSVDHVDRNTVSTANVKVLESITMVTFWSEFYILWTKVTSNAFPELDSGSHRDSDIHVFKSGSVFRHGPGHDKIPSSRFSDLTPCFAHYTS